MIPLHGKFPSWYSLPCTHLYANAYICKRQTETKWPIPSHFISKKSLNTCGAGQMSFANKCYILKRVKNTWPQIFETLTHIDLEYVIRLFSLICQHTLQHYNFLTTPNYSANTSPKPCIKFYPSDPYGKYASKIMTRATFCNMSDVNNTYFAESGTQDGKGICKINQYLCHDGTCALQEDVCLNGDTCSTVDCVCYRNDEKIFDAYYCRNACMPSVCHCPPHFFQCSTGGCIQMTFICDGKPQCADASDEFCGTESFPVPHDPQDVHAHDYVLFTNENVCLGYLCYSRYCISIRNVNDLIPDCPGGQAEDEPMFLGMRFHKKYFECRHSEYIPCVVGLPVCFPLDKFCLYDTDKDGKPRWCRNGAHLGECGTIICTNSYKCYESYCIPFHHVCNGHSDCTNGDDEEKCQEYQCQGLLRCRGTRVCVHPSQVCDGEKQCAEGDDEQLCDIMPCPEHCSCLSYSVICSTKFTNQLPLLMTETLKYTSIHSSNLPFPDFQHFNHQKSILYLRLTGNRIRYICKALENRCKFYRKLIILDVSNNSINVLTANCFKYMTSLRVLSLANNPLHTIQHHAFGLLYISYLNIRDTDITELSNDGLPDIKGVDLLDIRGVHLNYLDHSAANYLSNISSVLFDDSRLYCIFRDMKYQASVLISCPRILPHGYLGYIILAAGISLFSLNLMAIFVHAIFSDNHKNSLLVSFLLACDTALALYGTILGTSDIYYDSHFVFSSSSWHQSGLCRFMKVLSGTATILSLCMWTFITVVTLKGLTKMIFDISCYRRYLLLCLISLGAVLYNILLVVVQKSDDNSHNSKVHECYFVDGGKFKLSINTLSSVILSILMLVLYLVISFSVLKVIVFIAQTTGDVEKYSGTKGNHGQNQKQKARKVFIDLVLVKSMTNLPYPLLQLASLTTTDIPEEAHLSVIFAFIVLEAFFSPVLLVFKPLWKSNVHQT